MLRILPTFVEEGYPTLAITYRNDAEVMYSEDHRNQDRNGPRHRERYTFGQDEWNDLHAAVLYATENGAEWVVLVGYGMGGAIALSFVYNSMLADRVVGLILDSPTIDFEQTIDYRAYYMGIPEFLTASAKWLASVLYRIDYRALDYIDGAKAGVRYDMNTLWMPVFVFIGSADEEVPRDIAYDISEALYSPGGPNDPVRMVTTQGAGHVSSWNQNPEEYEKHVRYFMSAPVITQIIRLAFPEHS